MRSLIEEDGLYRSRRGANAFVDACAVNVIYEDRFHPQPFVGKQAIQEYLVSSPERTIRIDMISDGDVACGFAWTWITDDAEGLRGTTFVELNDQGKIQYVDAAACAPKFDNGFDSQSCL